MYHNMEKQQQGSHLFNLLSSDMFCSAADFIGLSLVWSDNTGYNPKRTLCFTFGFNHRNRYVRQLLVWLTKHVNHWILIVLFPYIQTCIDAPKLFICLYIRTHFIWLFYSFVCVCVEKVYTAACYNGMQHKHSVLWAYGLHIRLTLTIHYTLHKIRLFNLKWAFYNDTVYIKH